MNIHNRKELKEEIDKLSNLSNATEDVMLDHIASIRRFLNPVIQINKLLSVTAERKPQRFLNLLDDAVDATAYAVSDKIYSGDNDTFFGRTISGITQKSIYTLFDRNREKIKSLSVTIVKKIFSSLS